MGAVLGPIIGPVLGGLLTENLSWRWVFFINLPVGVLAVLGLLAVMPETRDEEPVRLDLLGFGLLALAVGAFQLMLDRGQMLDWFESREIWIEATLAASAFYLFVVHTLTARQPFVRLGAVRAIRNYLFGCFYGFFLGGMMFGVMALLAADAGRADGLSDRAGRPGLGAARASARWSPC